MISNALPPPCATKAFFLNLNVTTSADGIWFKGIKNQMERLIVQRKLLLGESLDQSANEIFLVHVRALCASFSKAGTAEAAARKLAVKTLWRAAGRAGEPGALNYNGLRWNELFGTAVIESPQSKPSKLKFVTFPAGNDRHADWLLDFGDQLIFQSRGVEHTNMVYQEGETPWLLPSLQGGNPGTKIAEYIKGLAPGGLDRYAPFVVKHLPRDPTAAGIRPGAADTLCCSVPAELAVHNTGHDLTGLSALWNYLQARIALCMPGAIVLAGWKGLPYGHMGHGPVHPTLEAITDNGVAIERLDTMIDSLFAFCDATLSKLRVDGELRPMLHCTLATQIMYYEERFEGGEMHHVLEELRNAYKPIAAPGENAHEKLQEWGAHILRRFNVDNLHLRDAKSHDGTEQIITAIKGLSSTVAAQQSSLVELQQRTKRMEHTLQSIHALLLRGGEAGGGGGTPPDPTCAAVTPIHPTSATPTSSAAAAAAAAVSSSATAAAMSSPASAAASSSQPYRLSSAAPHHSVSRPHQGAYSLGKLLSGTFYLNCMELGDKLPPDVARDGRRRPDAQKVLDAYNAMVKPAERTLLLSNSQDQQAASKVVRNLTLLLIRRIQQQYTERGVDYKQFGQRSIFVNTLCDNLRDSKLVIDSGTFRHWREVEGGGRSQESSVQPTQSTANASASDDGATPRGPSPRKPQAPCGGYAESGASDSEVSEGGADEGLSHEEENSSEVGLVGSGSQQAPLCLDE